MRFVSLLNAHKMPIVPFFIRLEGSPTAYGSAPFEDLPGILRPRLEAVPENRRKDWRYDVFLDGELVVPWSQEELLNPGHREARFISKIGALPALQGLDVRADRN